MISKAINAPVSVLQTSFAHRTRASRCGCASSRWTSESRSRGSPRWCRTALRWTVHGNGATPVPWFEMHDERSLAEHSAKLIDSSPFSDGATPARHSVQKDYIPDGSCVGRLLIAQEHEGRSRYRGAADEARIARNAIVFEGIVVYRDPRDKYRCGTLWSSPSSCSTDWCASSSRQRVLLSGQAFRARCCPRTPKPGGRLLDRVVEHAEECFTGRTAIRARLGGCRGYGGETTGSDSGTSGRRPHGGRRHGAAPCRTAVRCRNRPPWRLAAPSP